MDNWWDRTLQKRLSHPTMSDTSLGLSDKQEATDPRGPNLVWQFKQAFTLRWRVGHSAAGSFGAMLHCVESTGGFWSEKEKEAVVSSEFPSCALQQHIVQLDWNVYVVPLMRSPLLGRQNTKGIQSSGRCSSVAALKLQAWGFIVAQRQMVHWNQLDVWRQL